MVTTRLGDEKMYVKVIPVHREVNATYTVDENEIKMSLRIPPDWPLHVIEVRGGKKVGVKEDRWKSWMSGVRQVVLTQVCLAGLGLRGDSRSHASCRATSWMGSSFSRGTYLPTLKIKPSALSATRKHRFCHPTSWLLTMRIRRLISAIDGNLPNKPCQTCKNSFHASCLYEVRVLFCSLCLSRKQSTDGRPLASSGSRAVTRRAVLCVALTSLDRCGLWEELRDWWICTYRIAKCPAFLLFPVPLPKFLSGSDSAGVVTD